MGTFFIGEKTILEILFSEENIFLEYLKTTLL